MGPLIFHADAIYKIPEPYYNHSWPYASVTDEQTDGRTSPN